MRRILSVLLSALLIASPMLAGATPAFASTPATTSPPAASPAREEAPGASKVASPTVVRELVDERTVCSRTYLLSNGSLDSQFFSDPIFYRDPATSRMTTIDATLQSKTISGRSVKVNKANDFEIQLPDELTNDWISLTTTSTRIAMRPATVSSPAAATLGSATVTASVSTTATGRTYPKAFSDTTLDYTSLPDGLKETLVLSKPTTESVWGFDLSVDGATARLESDGSISIARSGETTPSFVIPRPTMQDSAETSTGPLSSDAVHYELSGTGPVYHLLVVADPAWLSDPSRVWPVRIDPTVVHVAATPTDTFISSHAQSTNYSSNTSIYVDNHYTSADWTEYALLQPGAAFLSDIQTKRSQGYQISSATLRMCMRQGYGTGASIQGSRCTSNVNISTVTWASRPSVDVPNTDAEAPASPNYFDISAIAQYWSDHNVTSAQAATIQMQTLTNNTRVFYISADDGSGTKPYYDISYAYTPSVSLTSPTSEYVSAPPNAAWTYSEGLGNAQAEYQIEVADSPDGFVLASDDVASAATNVALPEPEDDGWENDTPYYVHVRVKSAAGLWSGWSGWGSFTIESPTPPVESVSADTAASANWWNEASGPDNGNTAGRGSVTLSWPDADNATSYSIYLFDGLAYRKVATTADTSWSSAGAGIYPTDTQISQMTTGSAAPFKTGGLGKELRDDPRPLYSKTTGRVTNLDPKYYFKVVSANGLGESALSSAPTATVTLEDRSIRIADDPQHATYELGSDLFHHDGTADLERGSLELDVTDLKIASWGPDAELSRHYSSALTTATSYAPGWRFNFEKSLVVVGTTAAYTDETGDVHLFTKKGSTWVAPNGLVATLAASGSNWTITFKDRSVMTFDSSGQLVSEADADGNTVTYARVAGHLYITAANGQVIDVAMAGLGVVTQATYATADGTRIVEYDDGAGYSGANPTSVTYYPGTSDMYQAVYGYGENGAPAAALTSIACPQYVWSTSFDGPVWVFGYDGSSRLSSWQLMRASYPYGQNTITYGTRTASAGTAYDISSGASQTLSWNQNSELASETSVLDPGKSWTWLYGPTNAEIYSTTPLGHTVSSVLDAHDNVLSSTDELGHTTTSTYDSLDRELTQTDPRGAVDVKTYSGADLSAETKSLTSTQTARTEWSHNASGTVTEERQAISATMTAVTDYTDFAPNGEPQTTISRSVALSPGANSVDLTDTKHYDSFGNLIWEKNAAGQWVTKDDTYTISGLLASSEVVTGTVTSYKYNALGGVWVTLTTAPGGLSANCSLDVRNPVGALEDHVELTDADWNDQAGGTQSIPNLTGQPYETIHYNANLQSIGFDYARYDAEGHVTKQWDMTTSASQPSDASSTRTTYDAEGRAVSETAPGANSSPTITTYSPGGFVTRIENADGSWEEKAYDEAGDQITDTKSQADGDGATTTSSYDLGGRLISSTDENGAETGYAYDLAGHQLTVGITGHASSTSTYNMLGWVLSSTDQDGIVTNNTYDAAGHVIATSVGGKLTTSIYDDSGDLISQTDPAGATVHYEYDAFSRKVREWHESSEHADVKDIHTAYDYESRVTETSRTVGADVSETDDYDSAGLLSGATLHYGGTTSTVTYTEGNGTEQTRVVDAPDAPSFTRTVSAYDDQKRATDWAVTGGLSSTAHRDFDGAGHEATQTGTGLSGPATYTYGDDGRKGHEHLPFTLGSTLDAGYAYTADGRLATVSGSGAGTFAYDSAGDVATFTATIDGSGTTTSGVLSYDAAGRLSARSTTAGLTLETYGFDTAHGWRTSQRRSGEASATYGYDAAGHLTSYHRPAGSQGTTYAVDAAYAYDALGQRATSVVTTGSVTTTTTWTYDGLQLDSLAATNSAGATWSVTYLYDQEGRPFAGIYRSSASSPTEFGVLTTDGGDVAELSDSSGTVFAAYMYDAWGRPLSVTTQGTGALPAALASDIASRQPLRYAGYAFDSESGLYYCSAREYDPATMQFLTKDSAKADGEESVYQYCGGDPVGKTDPSGDLAVPLYAQEQPAWCLVAAIQMVEMFVKHKKDSQTQIHRWATATKSHPNGNADPNYALDWTETQRALKKIGFTHDWDSEQAISWTAVKSQINHGRPLILLTEKGQRHAVVAYWYQDETCHRSERIWVNDPEPVKVGSQWYKSYAGMTKGWGWDNTIVDLY